MGSPKQNGDSDWVRVAENLYRYRPAGMYYAYFWRGGKQIKKSLKTKDRPCAKRKLKDLLEQHGRLNPELGRQTIRQLKERYMATTGNLAASTVVTLNGFVRYFEKTWPGGLDAKVQDVLPSDVKAWIGEIGKREVNGHRIAKSTCNEYVRFVKNLFALAVEDGVIFESPAAGIKMAKRDDPDRRTPSFEEFKTIVTEIRSQAQNRRCMHSADFVEFLGLSGIGNGEAAALTKACIDWRKKEISVSRLKTGRAFKVPIFPQLEPLLRRLCEDAGEDPNAPLFEISNAKKALVGACSRLKLPYYSHRAFRRMLITRALEKGIDVKVIAEWQGHSDGGKLILDTYSHVRRPHHDEMAKLLGVDEETPESGEK